MKRIPLTQGQFAIVDDEDFDWLNQWKWYAAKNTYNGFMAVRGNPTIYMSRIITKASKGFNVDHKNHDTLDNRRCNLRICTRSQNNHNRKQQGGTSRYKGVSFDNAMQKWRARIGFNNKLYNLGYFYNESDAAVIYDRIAQKFCGEFALLNFPCKKGK